MTVVALRASIVRNGVLFMSIFIRELYLSSERDLKEYLREFQFPRVETISKKRGETIVCGLRDRLAENLHDWD